MSTSRDWFLAMIVTVLICLTDLGLAQPPLNPPGPSVVGLVGDGICSGVQISARFVLTSSHCVTAPGAPMMVVGPSGIPVMAMSASTNASNKLALVCSLPSGAKPTTTSTVIPTAGAAVTIESRPPKPAKAWSAASLVVSNTSSSITINAVPGHSLPCHGDSGGPANVSSGVVGILESVPTCGGPAVYNAVAPARVWIAREISKNDQSCQAWINYQLASPKIPGE